MLSTFQKVAMGMIGVAALTTLALQGRQTPAIFSGVTKLATGSLSTAEGTSSGAIG